MSAQPVPSQNVKPEKSSRKQLQIEFNDILKRLTSFYDRDKRILIYFLYDLGYTPKFISDLLDYDHANFYRKYPKEKKETSPAG